MYRPSGQSLPPPLFGNPGHEIQFYSDDDLLVDGMHAYLREAVDDGNGAFCVATKQHLEALAIRLKKRGNHMTAATEQGRYVALDVNDVVSAVTIEGRFDEARGSEFFGSIFTNITNSVTLRNPHLVFYGETSAALWALGDIGGALRLEELGNELGRTKSVSMLCPYSTQAFQNPGDTASLRMICREHAAILAPEGFAPWTEETVPEDLSDRWLAQERQSLESLTKLDYPAWQGEYRAAVMEVDLTQLFKKVEVAQAAVLTRLHELKRDAEHHSERVELMRAWQVLQTIKRDRLEFLE
jgi:hypothetical protein